MTDDRQWSHRVSAQETGKTLEQVLRSSGFSRREISRLKFQPPGILVNGMQRRTTFPVQEGDRILIRIGEKGEIPSEDGFFCKILYLDSDLVIVDKPSGLSCHPGKGHYRDNLGTYLGEYLGESSPLRPVGRLDRDTSGLVVFARNQMAAARLTAQRERGEFAKEYRALLLGTLTEREGTLDLPVGPRQGEKNRMQVTPGGQRAVTRYRVLEYGTFLQTPVTLAECHLETGRTHQIRVHMAYLGHPVLGDPFYGPPNPPCRLALHACKVSLYQPFTGQRIVREAVCEFLINSFEKSPKSSSQVL